MCDLGIVLWGCLLGCMGDCVLMRVCVWGGGLCLWVYVFVCVVATYALGFVVLVTLYVGWVLHSRFWWCGVFSVGMVHESRARRGRVVVG